MVLTKIINIWQGSLRRQLILGVAAIHAVLMTFFILDLIQKQSEFLNTQSIKQARSLAITLAASSTPWVLSNDVSGLDEIMKAQSNYSSLNYILIHNLDGKVLGSMDIANAGQFVNDPISLSLLGRQNGIVILIDDDTLIDVAAPIVTNGKQIAWARVGFDKKVNLINHSDIIQDGLLYTTGAILIGILLAYLMGSKILARVQAIKIVADQVAQGSPDARSDDTHHDELGKLAAVFNQMMDALQADTKIIREGNLRAEQANLAKSTFLTAMSHDLRTPLNAIIGFSEVMSMEVMGKMKNPKYAEYSSDILSSSKYLLELVNDILDISKLEAGARELCLEDVSLKEIVKDCYRHIEILADEKNITCHMDIAEDMAPIRADKTALTQIMLNLAGNSIKYTKPNGSLSIRASKVNDAHIIHVIDTGSGISKDHLSTIADPFERDIINPYHSHQEGTGLGLSIVKALVELHHGAIDIKSAIDEGTTVTIILPYRSIITAPATVTEDATSTEELLGNVPSQT